MTSLVCLQKWNPSIVDTLGSLWSVLYIERCPHFSYKVFGTQQSVHNTEVPLFQGCLLRGTPLYYYKPLHGE